MTEWKAVFRSKKKCPEDERWACTGCGAILDQNHKITPQDGTCQCPACTGKTVSGAYRENYRATFGHD
jgi:Zn finger protein HypA/HybF involved in hydrogenase expression